jgi:hypothetical protein
MKQDLVEIDNKFYQNVEVVILPTEKAENCLIKTSINKLRQFIPWYYYTQEHLKRDSASSFHLYFISEEEITEPCWCVNRNRDTLHFVKEIYSDTHNWWNKIIATTNPELKLSSEFSHYSQDLMKVAVYKDKFLPRPSTAFLEAYIREWNGGHRIEKCLVEMEIVYQDTVVHTGEGAYQVRNRRLKTAPDNTVTLKAIPKKKESWNEHEIITLLYQFATDNDILVMDAKNWIENHLKTLL